MTSIVTRRRLYAAAFAFVATGALTASAETYPASGSQAETGVRRLSQEQYRNVIADVFGPTIKVGGRFEPDIRRDGLLAIGASEVSVTASGLEQYDQIARSIAMQVVSFLILFVVLYKFGIKPTIATMEERNSKIASGLKHAEEMQAKLAAAAQESAAIIKAAQLDAQKAIDEARKAAKEFTDKQGLGDALVVTEGQLFLEGIHAVLASHTGDIGGGITAAVEYTLKEAEASPLLKAALTSTRTTEARDSATGVLPLLPTSASLLELSSAALITWFGEHFDQLDCEDVNEVADVLVRLTVSHLVLPAADAHTTGRRISQVALRYLAPR